MADRPILFSAPMVRALLEGRKTQTRRVISRIRTCAMPECPPVTLTGDDLSAALAEVYDFRRMDGDIWSWKATPFPWQQTAAFTTWLAHVGYAVGDRLWVREGLDLCRGGRTDLPVWSAGYVADGADLDLTAPALLAWAQGYKRRMVPSIHMPRSASRITLVVTDVRVQRLHDISEADAIAEGVGDYEGECCLREQRLARHQLQFAALWDLLYGAGAWDLNPWVAAITFEPTICNIDRMETVHG